MAHYAPVIPRQYADNCVDAVIQFERSAEDLRIGMQAASPEAIRDYGGKVILVALRIEAADKRMNPEHVEEIRARIHSPNDLRVVRGLQVRVVDAGVEGKGLKRRVRAQLVVERVIQVRRRADQPVQVPRTHVVEHQFADHAVNREIRADTQCERCDGNRGKGRRSAERADCLSHS